MSARSFFRNLFSRPTRPIRRAQADRTRRARLGVEGLEDRSVPALLHVGAPFEAAAGWPTTAHQAVASDSDGNFVVAWTNPHEQVFARLYAADGTPRTGDVYVGQTSESDPGVRVAMNGAGQFVVAWTHPWSGTDPDVYFRRFWSDGSPNGETIRVADSAQVEKNPSVAINGWGEVIVAYEYASGGIRDVRARQYDMYNRPRGDAFGIAQTDRAEWQPAVAMNENGAFAVAWTEQYAGTDLDVRAYYYSNEYNAQPVTVNVATSYADSETSPAVAVGWDGFVVSYAAAPRPDVAGGRASSDVYASRFNGAGGLLGRVEVAATAAREFQPAMDMDRNGNFAVAYTAETYPGTAVRLRQFAGDGTGAPEAVPFDLTPTAGSTGTPSVALGDYGRVTAVISRDVSNGINLGANGVHVQRFQSAPFRIAVDLSQQVDGPTGRAFQLTNGQSVDLPVTIVGDTQWHNPELTVENLPRGVNWSYSEWTHPDLRTFRKTLRFTADNVPPAGTFQAVLTARHEGAEVLRVPITFRLVPGYVFGVRPSDGAPADTVVKGTRVSVYGAGFLPGSTVRFGNSQPVTAVYNSPGGDRLDVIVPADATSGPVSVTTPYGATLFGPRPITVVDRGAIRWLSTTEGRAPEALHQGTPVTIEGYGFTSVSGVSFGGAWATPTYVSESFITVNVPRHALTGTITVHTGNGDIQSPQSFTVSDFRNTNGFSFPNYNFSISLADVVEAFHPSLLEAPQALAVWGIAAASLNGKGACFGMALVTQYMSHGRVPIDAAHGLPAGQPATVYNLRMNDRLGRVIGGAHVAQYSAEVVRYTANWKTRDHTAAAIYAQIRDELLRGERPIISLQKGLGGHAVVAYDLTGDAATGFKIHTYDPNRMFDPNERGNFAFHQQQEAGSEIYVQADGTWLFVMAGGEHWGGDGRSLMVLPYSVLAGEHTLPDPFDIPRGVLGQVYLAPSLALFEDETALAEQLGETDFATDGVDWDEVRSILGAIELAPEEEPPAEEPGSEEAFEAAPGEPAGEEGGEAWSDPEGMDPSAEDDPFAAEEPLP